METNKGILKHIDLVRSELTSIEKELESINKLSNFKVKDLIPYNMKSSKNYRVGNGL
jgi:hypothetical protein